MYLFEPRACDPPCGKCLLARKVPEVEANPPVAAMPLLELVGSLCRLITRDACCAHCVKGGKRGRPEKYSGSSMNGCINLGAV